MLRPVISIEFIQNKQKWQSRIFRFENGYGASVQSHRGNYGYEDGLWELAVVKFLSADAHDFDIVYNTTITDNVLGWLTYSDAMREVYNIAHLPRYVSVPDDTSCVWELNDGVSTKRTYGEEEPCQSVISMNSASTPDTPSVSPATVTTTSSSNVIRAIVSYMKNISKKIRTTNL
jgi:hypothetical protein